MGLQIRHRSVDVFVFVPGVHLTSGEDVVGILPEQFVSIRRIDCFASNWASSNCLSPEHPETTRISIPGASPGNEETLCVAFQEESQ